MKDLENTHEMIDSKTRSLRHFFENLPEAANTHHIERAVLDELIEHGVSVEDICNEFVRKGFLLHGTGLALEVIEPKQARDEGGHPDNSKNAVYATGDPRIPLFMSLVKGINGHAQYSITTDIDLENNTETEMVVFSTSFEIPADKVGYVHVLDADSFEISGSDQFTSVAPVAARFVIPVTLSDFPYPVEKIKE